MQQQLQATSRNRPMRYPLIVSFRSGGDDVEDLDRLAESLDRDRGYLLRKALREFLDRHTVDAAKAA